ncbi:carboxylesterase/lipase family protein [Pseudochryseolinea flava]|uniref:Carboxylic ester hydrolase n=1 Tax=Pseudochryseolinea flava TaxID=2059302 RepID=A0A364Y4H6_9BACT|nr:carboxylesterase family protein [Pseudochryseolinea flava]RAW00951.1 carboxylesterase family protein [Pseudochryseolinea flava]
MKYILLLCLSFLFHASAMLAQGPTIKTSNGIVEGINEEEISIFKGIPFAAPPTGKLRWKAPQPVKNWSGILKCNSFRASAMQQTPKPYQMWTEEFIPPVTPISEDCLYLNVWTPAKSAAEKLPVIVWIHGGGFVVGSGSCPIYDGLSLAKKKVIFVTINYRLGVFGFLAHSELTTESGKNTSGNYGILDQIASLKWVKKNIEAFGGDPNNVTIAGQSAGSMSVQALILSPLARGLFQKAISQSGGFSTDMASRQLNAVSSRGEKLLKALNVKTLSALRDKSAAEIMKASEHFPFFPVYDGYVLPTDPVAHIQQKKHNDVSFISGWATGDAWIVGKKTMTIKEFKEEAHFTFGNHANDFLKAFPATNQEEVTQSVLAFSICKFAVLPTHLIAEATKKKAYVYQFSFVPTDKPNFPNYGAFHSADIPYALHNLRQWNRPWQTRDKKLEELMSNYWVNFARTGNPNGNGLPTWKSYDTNENNILEFNDAVTSKVAFYRSEVAFLKQMLTQ